MDLASLTKHRTYRIAAVILIFMGVAFVLRMVPAFFIKDPGFLYTYDTDSWYTLRQIEVMVRDFPQYNWFDPMTAYPTGKLVDWGPLYPFIAATLCLITGATTRSAIIFTAGWVAPHHGHAYGPGDVPAGKDDTGREYGDYRGGIDVSCVCPVFYLFIVWVG